MLKKEPTVDLFDTGTTMESDYLPSAKERSSSESDFAFAFNDSNFSDRVLRIEILADLPSEKLDGEVCKSIADWARNRKRRREEITRESGRLILLLLTLFLVRL